MSKSIPVTDGTNVIYTIELKKDFGDLCKELTRLKISPDQKLCIVTDSNVAPLYAKEVQDQLSAVFSNVFLHIFPAGEASKNTDTVGALYQFLIENHFDRRDILLAAISAVLWRLLQRFCLQHFADSIVEDMYFARNNRAVKQFSFPNQKCPYRRSVQHNTSPQAHPVSEIYLKQFAVPVRSKSYAHRKRLRLRNRQMVDPSSEHRS